MNLLDLGIGSIIKSVGNVIDDLHTSDEEELKLGLEAKKLELEEKVIEAKKQEQILTKFIKILEMLESSI